MRYFFLLPHSNGGKWLQNWAKWPDFYKIKRWKYDYFFKSYFLVC